MINLEFLSVRIVRYVVIISLSLIPILAQGNIAEPPEPSNGSVTGPSNFQSISVTSEHLTVDLSALKNGGKANIRAVYKISVPETLYHVELIFVANDLYKKEFSVFVDNQSTQGYLKHFDSIPSTWRAPDTILYRVPLEYYNEGLISFTIDSITAGEHTLEVEYKANAGEHFEHLFTSIERTFVYILKPYNGWKTFKNLTLSVQLPEGWHYDSNLELSKQSDNTYQGFWEELPAHHLAIVTWPDDRYVELLTVLYFVLSVGLLMFGLYLWIRYNAKSRLKRKQHKALQWTIRILNLFFMSILTTVALFLIYLIEPELRDFLLDNHTNPFYDYGRVYLVFAAPVVLLVVLVVLIIIDLLINKRLKRDLG
jgi:hypothetical protein